MKAPFGRTGGKSRSAKRIIELFPEDAAVYVEPFVGAGNIFFRLTSNKKPPKTVINDLDEDVYIIMNGLKTNAKHINDNIKRTVITREEWRAAVELNPVSKLERVRSSFMSNTRSFNPNLHAIKTDFTIFAPPLKDTIILNRSFESVIEEYDSPDTFFYLDPPYEFATKYKNYKNHVNPEHIYRVVSQIKGRFILSYNDSENIREIFREYHITSLHTTYTNTQLSKTVGTKQINELIISNFCVSHN
jgi:DNA adenine methylase